MNHIQRFARILTIGNGILLPAAIIIFCLDGVSGFAEMGMASIINAILGFTIPMTIGTCLLFFYARQWRQPRRHAWIGWLLSTMYNAYAMFLWWAGVALSMGISVLPIALWVTLTCALSALALMMGNPNQKVQHKVVYRSLRRNTARALLFALFAFLLYHFLSELILVPKYYSIPISISKSAYMAIGEVGLLLFYSQGQVYPLLLAYSCILENGLDLVLDLLSYTGLWFYCRIVLWLLFFCISSIIMRLC